MKSSGAKFSRDKKYRYLLWRVWDSNLDMINFIGLNPSTADAEKDDTTMRRCISFAKEWGYGGFYMTNLFAYRTPYPSEIKKIKNPVGKQNDKWIRDTIKKVDTIVLAWGTHGSYLDRDQKIYRLTKGKCFCLAYTKNGHPKHPLYIKSGIKLLPYQLQNKDD